MQQRTATASSSEDAPTNAPAWPRPAADVPSEQLWREAIRATREAATAAADLRRALQAARTGVSPA